MNRYDEIVIALHGTCHLKNSQPRHLSETDLETTERAIGHRLPGDYREFLRDYGGFSFHSSPSCPMKQQIAWVTRSSVGVFYGVSPGHAFDLLRVKAAYDSRIPKELLTIADSGCGSQICIALAGANTGAMYLWERDGVTPADYSNTYLIADSFDAFIKSISVENEDGDQTILLAGDGGQDSAVDGYWTG